MSKKSRKTYKKPEINQVKLVIEEAVLAVCKIAAGAPAMESQGGHCNFTKCQFKGS
jgi:hypothetical protein